MGQIPMPGGWTMSTMWLPMCGQSWFGAMAGFIGTWAAMMVPMMLPLAVPPLLRYRAALDGAGPWRTFLLMATAGLAWAVAWTMSGVPLYLAGTALARALPGMPALARMMPALAAAAGVAGAGWHLASWRRRSLRPADAVPGPAVFAAALRQGARLGGHCVRRCTGLTVALLAAGFMETGTMAGAAVVVAAEVVAAVLAQARAPGRGLSARARP
jgi:predicted metal-binding membrane protein